MKSTKKLHQANAERPVGMRGAQLLDALEEIFLREGFRRVTIGELAARLHCSRQTLYQLADSKDGLVMRVFDRILSRIRRMGTEAAGARRDIRDRIVALVEPGSSELRRASSLFFADVATLPPAKRLLEEHQKTRREELQQLLSDGMRQGAFRGIHSRLAAEVILAAVRSVMDSSFLVEVGLSAGEAIRGAEDLLLHGLLHPGEHVLRRQSRVRQGTHNGAGVARDMRRPPRGSRPIELPR